MSIHVKAYAAFAELIGVRELKVGYREGMTCSDLWSELKERYPRIASIPPLFAIQEEYVPADTKLSDEDTLMLFPPVSGGDHPILYEDPLSVDRTLEAIRDENGGGEAIFLGRVRRISEGRRIQHLYYECQTSMAEKVIRRIMEEMHQRWPLKRVHIEHRIGKLEVGDTAVIVGVSSEHRKEAMEACRYGIDELKHRAPIWKKEVSETGEVWVGACSHDEVES